MAAVLAIVFGSLAVVGLVLPGLMPSALLGPQDPPPGSGGSPVSSTSTPGTTCNSVSSPTPSSVLVPIPGPSSSLGAGGSLTAVLEFGAVNYTSAGLGAKVSVPSVFATLPLAPSGSTQLYFSPHTFTVTSTGWLNASQMTKAAVENSGLSFASNGSAVLSTQKIAVVADANYGNLTLEVRWHWSLSQPNGSVVTGAWSVPTPAAHWPTSVPSEFYPAPNITLISSNGPHVTIGTNFTATLGGHVAGRYFFLELEFPSTGNVVQSHGQTAAAGAVQTVVTIPMLNYNRYLDPGTYLVHIHDVCGAMLLSLSESAAFAAHATVTIATQPTSCGSVVLNGSSYSNGQSAIVVPSSTPFPFTLSACAGHSFQNWHFSGGLYLSSSNQLRVSSSGTFTVDFS